MRASDCSATPSTVVPPGRDSAQNTPDASRRARRLAALCCIGLLVVAGCGGGQGRAGHRGRSGTSGPRSPAHGQSSGGPTRVLTPTASWRAIKLGSQAAVQGFADRISVLPGQPVRVFVSTTAPAVAVTAFRMGWYGGVLAAQVGHWGPFPGRRQAVAATLTATRTTYAPWRPSLTVDTTGWPPGDYLFRLDASSGYQSLVPLTVRSPSTAGRLTLLNAVTTWQAYNTWGGRSLYAGPDGSLRQRAYAVSFDRPYAFGAGAADFLSNELPVVALAERLRLPLAYATDVDLHANAHLLDGARALVSLGHDEYWSAAMRAHTTVAREGGMNIAFLGANAVYRPIRLAPTPLGPDRLEIAYKDARLDPVFASDPGAATGWSWDSPPNPRPQSVLTGTFYECNPVRADMVAVNASNWLLAGVVHSGQRLRGLVGAEFDRVDPAEPTPRPIEVLFHSPVTCRGRATYSDAAYYTTGSGAGVFNAGTSAFVCALAGGGCGDSVAQQAVTGIVTRLLTAFAAGPAGRDHPARDNLASLGIGGPPAPGADAGGQPAGPAGR